VALEQEGQEYLEELDLQEDRGVGQGMLFQEQGDLHHHSLLQLL